MIMIPRALAPAPKVESPIETRALEFFFHKTMPHLAGFFEGALFQGGIVHIGIAEPAIRNAIAAVAMFHEEISPQSAIQPRGNLDPRVSIRLYNRSIRGVIERLQAGPTVTPLIALASILFSCFESWRGNQEIAKSHVQSGIQILHSWRERANGSTMASHPWGQKYDSSESRFMEMEIAPLLSVLGTSILDRETARKATVILHPVNDPDNVVLGDRFDNPRQARVGLQDVMTYASWRIQTIDVNLLNESEIKSEVIRITNSSRQSLDQWEANFDDLLRRRSLSWSKADKQAADIVRIIHLADRIGRPSYMAGSECAWDNAKAEYTEMLSLVEDLVSDNEHYPHDGFEPLSLDFGKLSMLHLLAWKCRWPRLRRRGLDLFENLPRREAMLDTQHYHTIFSRIMEIEEAHLRISLDEIVQQDLLPPEHSRIHDFTVTALSSSRKPAVYAVSFWSKPQGLDGPSSCVTEYMQLGDSQLDDTSIPRSLIPATPSSLITQYYRHLGPRQN